MNTATYTCNDGYTLTGDPTRMCQDDGMWSGSPSTCRKLFNMQLSFLFNHTPHAAVDCGSLTITNGTVDTSSGTTFMNTANYTCDPGYMLVGNMMRTCQSDGAWSPAAPTCRGEFISFHIIL